MSQMDQEQKQNYQEDYGEDQRTLGESEIAVKIGAKLAKKFEE